MLIRFLRVIEAEDPARALELYIGACDLFEIDNKEYYGLDTFRQALAAAIKAKKYVNNSRRNGH